MNPLELHAPEIAEHVAEHRDVDACKALWWAVIKRTIVDLRYLAQHTERPDLKKHHIDKLIRIEYFSPMEFVEGAWFEEVCGYLGVEAEELRREVDQSHG